ncbi:unnamed protein product [Rotaria socialis]
MYRKNLDPLWTGIEKSSVPLSSYLTVVNNSYLCYADPMNSEQQPLKCAPDIVGARHEFLWRTCIPGLIAAPGIGILVVTCIFETIEKCRSIIKLRPRGVFRIRTHPTSTT